TPISIQKITYTYNTNIQTFCQATTVANRTIFQLSTVTPILGRTVAYRWYSNSINSFSGSTLISNNNQTTYIPSVETVGTTYYFVGIGDSLISNNVCTGIIDNIIPIGKIEILQTPSISNPTNTDTNYCIGGIKKSLTVSTNKAGILNIRWYRVPDGISTAINGIIQSNTGIYDTNFIPLDSIGTRRYYAVVTQSLSNCVATSAVSGFVNVYQKMGIKTQPIGANYCTINAAISPIFVLDTFSLNNLNTTVQRQWYKSTTQGDSIILSATGINFTPSQGANKLLSDTANNYFVLLSYGVTGLNNTCDSLKSNIATINIYTPPIIDTTNGNFGASTYCSSILNSFALRVFNPTIISTKGFGGNYTYQWYKNTQRSTLNSTIARSFNTNLNTNKNYAPFIDSIGTNYYYVVVTNSVDGCTSTSTVTDAINVVGLPNAVFSFNSSQSDTVYCEGNITKQLIAAYSGETNFAKFEWYSNTNAGISNGSLIKTTESATVDYFSPRNDTASILYYYVVVTPLNVKFCNSSIITSDRSSKIIVNKIPTINSTNFSTSTLQYCQNNTYIADSLKINYSPKTDVQNNLVTFKWYDTSNKNIQINAINTDSFYAPAITNV
ncbi:MAG: hypothetical protein ORN58_02270, partial [Sediminibacterium sp.]|nr:hypothetical protein [Sediminibacterium sp.]